MVERTMATTGQKLRRLRRLGGLTQSELAKRAMVSPATIAAIEADHRRQPHPATLVKLAQTLGVSTIDLLDDD